MEVKNISTELTDNGMPENVLFSSGNGFKVSKELGKVFLSLPVNNNKMNQCKITLSYNGNEIETKTVPISDSRYATYSFDNLKDREEGLYLVGFYDMNDEINQYVTIIITP